MLLLGGKEQGDFITYYGFSQRPYNCDFEPDIFLGDLSKLEYFIDCSLK